jgi:hypothetical protein
LLSCNGCVISGADNLVLAPPSRLDLRDQLDPPAHQCPPAAEDTACGQNRLTTGPHSRLHRFYEDPMRRWRTTESGKKVGGASGYALHLGACQLTTASG